MKTKIRLLCQQPQLAMRYLFIATVLLLLYGTSTAPAQTAEQIAQTALAATVYLEMKDNTGKTTGFGSGFFVKPDLIVTNYHVIAGAASGTAKLVNKYTHYNIEGFTAVDETNDLALLKVTAYGIKPLSLGDSDDVKTGMTVYVAGNPKGLEGTFSNGIISSRRDNYTQERFQMTAPVSPGSSGGPVLNSNGEVIEISFMTIEGGQNLNFAIPSNYLKSLLTRSESPKSLSQGNYTISAETYFRSGNKKYELNDYNGAIADYTQAIRLKPDFAEAYHMRAAIKAHLHQYLDAITDFDKAIKIKPNYVKAYLGRGFMKHNLREYFAAISDFDKAIEIEPDDAIAYYLRGKAKEALKHHSAAISDFDKAIEIKPNYAEAYVNRGKSKDFLGQHFAAISDFDKAIQLKPDYAKVYYDRGSAKIPLVLRQV